MANDNLGLSCGTYRELQKASPYSPPLLPYRQKLYPDLISRQTVRPNCSCGLCHGIPSIRPSGPPRKRTGGDHDDRGPVLGLQAWMLQVGLARGPSGHAAPYCLGQKGVTSSPAKTLDAGLFFCFLIWKMELKLLELV